jgi:hypothetical protein
LFQVKSSKKTNRRDAAEEALNPCAVFAVCFRGAGWMVAEGFGGVNGKWVPSCTIVVNLWMLFPQAKIANFCVPNMELFDPSCFQVLTLVAGNARRWTQICYPI